MRFYPAAVLLAMCALAINAAASPVYAQSAQSSLQASVDAMDAWLSTSQHGPVWHDFLMTEPLKAEMAKGHDADVDAVREILAQYTSGKSGLTHKYFATTRDALEAWIEELELPKQNALGEVATTAVEDIEPIEPEKIDQARQKLVDAADTFDNFLKRGGEEKEQGWKEFTRFDDLQAELALDEPHRDTLVQVWAILAGSEKGLKHSRFVALRESLRNYLELSDMLGGDDENLLAKLPQRLGAFEKTPDEQNAAALGEALGWLERTGQGAGAVKAIRYHFARPNFLLQASERLVVHGFAEKIDATDPITDYTNGNSTSGTAHTTGDVSATLVPNGRYGEVLVELTGVSKSRTRTSGNSGVSFNTNGVTQIYAQKPVMFTERGFGTDPATARGRTENTTFNIRAPSAQVESIARQRIAQGKASGERRSSQRTEQRIKRDLDQRVRKQLAEANQQMQDDFFGPLARRGVEPRMLRYHTSGDKLYSTMILAAPEHLAAPSDPPAAPAEGDVTARMHESWVNNLADIIFRGAVMTDIGLADAMDNWRGEVPAELQVTDDTEPWDITFASRRPVLLTIDNDKLSITLRGERFTARNRAMHEPMHISAVYKVDRKDGAVRLVRDGDVAITFPDQGDKLSVRYLALRKFWQTKFDALFEPELDDLSLRLRGTWESAGPLKLTGLTAGDNGWIGLAWVMPEAEADKGAE